MPAPRRRAEPVEFEPPALDTWHARWIWHPDAPSADAYVYFRKTIELDAHPQQAQLFLSANSRYHLFVNGAFIARGPDRCDPAWKYYDGHDLTGCLQPGANVIAVLVWRCGPAAHNVSYDAERGGLIAALRREMPGGRIVEGGTDASWRCEPARAWSLRGEPISDRGAGWREIYDPAEAPAGSPTSWPPSWTGIDFDDSNWAEAIVLGAHPCRPFMRLIPREIPPLRETTIKPVAVARATPNLGKITRPRACITGGKAYTVLDARRAGSLPELVVDFGREAVGYVELAIETEAQDGWLMLSYGESLDLKRLDALRIRPGRHVWGPLGRRAFRWLGLTLHGADQPVRLSAVRLHETGYPFPRAGSFTCSDPYLNAIWETGRRTVEACSQDHFEDCPGRRQALGSADLRVMSLVAYYAFGDARLTAKCLRQMARLQNRHGLFPGEGPVNNDRVLPDFCLWWIITLGEYWRYTGDDQLAAELFAPAMQVLAAFEREVDHVGLIGRCEREAWTTFIDDADIRIEGHSLGLNILFKAAMDAAAELAAALSRPVESDRWAQLAAGLTENMRSHGFDPERGLFADTYSDGQQRGFSEQVNALAVVFGVASSDAREAPDIMERVLTADDIPPTTTPFMNLTVAEALFSVGADEQAVELIRDYWGEMMARGATTFWERFDLDSPRAVTPLRPDDPYRVSRCHGWGAGPTYLLPRYILGVTPAAPGFAAVRVAPQPAGLTHASGTVPTPQGPVSVRWHQEKGTGVFTLSVTLPRELPLEISLPLPPKKAAEVRLGRRVLLTPDGELKLPQQVKTAEVRAGRLHLSMTARKRTTFKVS